MIDSLFFVLQAIGILVLVGWAVINDRLPTGASSRGPLAFKDVDGGEVESPKAARGRRGLTRSRGRSNLKRRDR